jgi:nucleoside-diphosphate-sugar epimerase
VFPGNVYNFSPDALPLVSESSPQRPLTKKGAIRVEMEESLREAAARGAKVLIVRAGDFYGPGATARNSWLAGALVKPNRPVTRITYPGPPDTGHAWAYLPDMAETVMRLIERDAALPGFAVFHFGGHWFDNGTALADAIRAASGNPDIPLGRLPWWLVKAVAPFHETFREMLEMRYLWEVPLRLDNGRLVDFLGSEPHTPTEEAIRATLRALGCLDRSADVDADLAGGQRRVGAQRQVNA